MGLLLYKSSIRGDHQFDHSSHRSAAHHQLEEFTDGQTNLLQACTDTNQNHEIDKYKAQSGVIINMNTAVADQHLVRFTDPLAAGSGSEFQYQPTSISGLANLTDQHRTTGWKNSASQDYDDEH